MTGDSLRIEIATPVRADSSRGNGVTARRWRTLLADLGHDVEIVAGGRTPDRQSDMLIALHARKSAPEARAYRESYPDKKIVLAMTGTDLYEDLPTSPEALSTIEVADRIVVLQPLAAERLPSQARDRVRVIFQSVSSAPGSPPPRGPGCPICVLAHLREVKDPLCAARASALLPPASRVQVTLAGGVQSEEWERRVTVAQADNPRFIWVGEKTAAQSAALLAGSVAIVVSSEMEGGANVVSEAVVRGVAVLATRIDGNVGLLGSDYEGYFPVGDEHALAELMTRIESEPKFLGRLEAHLLGLRSQFEPARERQAWVELLAELF